MTEKTTFQRIDELSKRFTNIRSALRNLDRTEEGRNSETYQKNVSEGLKIVYQIFVLFSKLAAETLKPGATIHVSAAVSIVGYLDMQPTIDAGRCDPDRRCVGMSSRVGQSLSHQEVRSRLNGRTKPVRFNVDLHCDW